MSREQALSVRAQRNAALIEAMMLAASADGRVSENELQTVLRRVLERPEFEGTRPEELNALVEESVRRLAGAKSLESVLQSLRERLPDRRNRMLAFGLAAAVAFGDQRASRAELGLLKTIQAALGISEDEVAQIISVIDQNGSLAEALGEPLEQLYAEVMVLVTAADGKVKEAEALALVESLVADPLFQNVSPERAQAFVTAAVTAIATEGLPRRVAALAHGLSSHSRRLKAFRLAMKIASAPGTIGAGEQQVLDLLQATFGLADDEVARIRAQS